MIIFAHFPACATQGPIQDCAQQPEKYQEMWDTNFFQVYSIQIQRHYQEQRTGTG